MLSYHLMLRAGALQRTVNRSRRIKSLTIALKIRFTQEEVFNFDICLAIKSRHAHLHLKKIYFYFVHVWLILKHIREEMHTRRKSCICKYQREDSICPYNSICVPLSNVQTFLHKPAVILVSLCVCVSVWAHSSIPLSGVMTEPFHSGRKGLPVHSLTVLRGWSGCVYMCVPVPTGVSHQSEKPKSYASVQKKKKSCIF